MTLACFEKPELSRALQIERTGVELANHKMSFADLSGAYPERAADRARWILARRGGRNPLDPFKPHAFLVEEERAESGEIVSVATIFLTNRECPWRCLMCDLWRNTLLESVPPGAIPAQIDYALAELAKQPSAGVQIASPGKISIAGPNREQPGSRDPQAARPSRKLSLTGHAPSPRRSPPREGETSAVAWPFSSPEVRLPSMMRAPRQIKLYNSGSFFDRRAIPPEDYPAIADRVREFQRMIVECHPALVGESVLTFRDLLGVTDVSQAGSPNSQPTPDPSQQGNAAAACVASLSSFGGGGGGFASAGISCAHGARRGQKLEVAMGLETAHPEVLEKLNKRMTLEQFRRAAEFLRNSGISLRVFVLVRPPFLGESEAIYWTERSLDFAFDCGATAVSLIPTRFGNGALEALAGRGEFSPPQVSSLEAALEYGIGLKRGRVFADLWDLEQFSACSACFERRRARLRGMNFEQVFRPVVDCEICRRHKSGPAKSVTVR